MYKRVMIVDDNEMDRYIGERNIIKHLFAEEVVLKESAKKALDYLASLNGKTEELPQLIFLDIRMPEMDGFGFLEEYEKLPETIKKNCIVMMLTSSLDSEDQEKAKNNRYISRFLNKPLDKEKLGSLSQDT